VRGDLVMGEGASIQTDPKGGVALSGDTVLVQGRVVAPGGAIAVSGSKDSTLLFANPSIALPTVDLGSKSFLSTAGATSLTPDARGYRTGSVLAGGTINVAGNIVAESGAKLDVSGASGVLDLAPTYSAFSGAASGSLAGAPVVATRVESNAGAITIAGAQELFTDATLVGKAGGPSALGGSLTISSGKFYPLGTNAGAQTPLTSPSLSRKAGRRFPRSRVRPGPPRSAMRFAT
jgi:hypothetical protein